MDKPVPKKKNRLRPRIAGTVAPQVAKDFKARVAAERIPLSIGLERALAAYVGTSPALSITLAPRPQA